MLRRRCNCGIVYCSSVSSTNNQLILHNELTNTSHNTRLRRVVAHDNTLAKQTDQRILHEEDLGEGPDGNYAIHLVLTDAQSLQRNPHSRHTPLNHVAEDEQHFLPCECDILHGLCAMLLTVLPHRSPARQRQLHHHLLQLREEHESLLHLPTHSGVVHDPRRTAHHAVAQLAVVALIYQLLHTLKKELNHQITTKGGVLLMKRDGRNAVHHVQHGGGQVTFAEVENEKIVVLPAKRVGREAVLTHQILTDTERFLDKRVNANAAALYHSLQNLLVPLTESIRNRQNTTLNWSRNAFLTLVDEMARNHPNHLLRSILLVI